MIRASSLNTAQHCAGYLSILSQREPSAALDAGTAVHRYIEAYVGGGRTHADETAPLPLELAAELDEYWTVIEHALSGLRDVQCEVDAQLGPLRGRADAVGLDENGERVVIDWKWGHGQRHILPFVAEDLQMRAYGALFNAARVLRVRICDDAIDELELTPLDHEDLLHRVQLITDANQEFRTGPHCEHCLARTKCAAWRASADTVTTLLAPSQSTTIASLTRDQATRWALARQAVKQRTEDLDEALRAYLEAGGIVEADGKHLMISEYGVDHVTEPAEAFLRLQAAVSGAAVLAVSLSKSGIATALKAAGFDKTKTEGWINQARTDGLIAKRAQKRMAWK